MTQGKVKTHKESINGGYIAYSHATNYSFPDYLTYSLNCLETDSKVDFSINEKGLINIEPLN